MATVIDKLIVTLGLDPSDFDKGQKQAAAAVVRTKDQVKRANQEMGADFVAFTKKFLSAAAAIAMLKKLVGALADVATETRRLGIDSENFNLAANRLRNLQNAVEMIGGKADDVTRSVEGLQKAVFDLTVMGQSSASLEMLTRLGVQFQDATGHARKFEDIMLDTADALERAQKSGTLNYTEAFFAAQQAGFDEGTARLMLKGRSGLQAEMSRQQGRHQINAEDLAAAEKIERARTEVSQRATSAGVQANTTAAAAGETVANAFEATVSHASDAIDGLASAAERASGAIERSRVQGLTAEQREREYAPVVAAAAKKHGVPVSVLHGLLKQESNYDPNARSPTGALGIAQFLPSTARDFNFTPGIDPRTDIDKAAQYMRVNYDIAQRRARPGEDPWALAAQYYNSGASGVTRARLPADNPRYKPLQSAADPEFARKVMDYAQQAGYKPTGSTTINVGPVTVNTAATDANGIASDMRGAVQRKLNVAQSDGGMR